MGTSITALAQADAASPETQTDSATMTTQLFAAGSLKVALTEVANAWSADTGETVTGEFAPSGLLRERIEAGEPAQLFASANMRHPETLRKAGYSESVVLFARNQLCALTAPGFSVSSEELLSTLLDDNVRVGTSTPGADPSGDYAFALFAKAEALQPGARQALESKSLQLTGGPDSQTPPEGRNNYAWVMDTDQADVFLTYCTNAVLAQKEVPDLGNVSIPEALAVGADYGLTVLKDAPASASQLALYILSPAGQSILAEYGFSTVTLPH